MERRFLTEQEKQYFADNGYLIDLPPVFSAEDMVRLNKELEQLTSLLEPGEKLLHMREWHTQSRWLYDICSHPRILDYVEGILGPDFFMWGSQFFAKEPGSPDTVAWHQDAYYWSLSPHHSVTVWLAFTDVDEANGAMRVIPGTHNKGIIRHRKVTGNSVLTLELEQGTFNEADAKSLVLRAGQVSLHDDNIVHGSPANLSDRWRIGLTIRYSSTIVRSDLSRAPRFKSYMMRGTDRYKHNPVGDIPVAPFGRLPRNYYANDEKVVRPT